jgi:hypothetical protein
MKNKEDYSSKEEENNISDVSDDEKEDVVTEITGLSLEERYNMIIDILRDLANYKEEMPPELIQLIHANIDLNNNDNAGVNETLSSPNHNDSEDLIDYSSDHSQ